jgi:methionyl-tRNA formyltransferase
MGGQPQPQDHSQATYTRKFMTEDGEIKTTNIAEQAYNKIRALNPEPGTYFWIDRNGKKLRLKILEARLPTHLAAEPLSRGLFVKDGRLALGLKKGYMILKTVQPDGKTPMKGEDFARGFF